MTGKIEDKPRYKMTYAEKWLTRKEKERAPGTDTGYFKKTRSKEAKG